MKPAEKQLRPLYNNDIRNVMRTIQTTGGLDYENAVNDLVQKYAGVISPQEIGDTLYGIYSDVLGAPQARYYGVDMGAGGYGGRAGGGGVPQVTVDLSSKINALNQMYDILYKDIADLTQSRRGELEKSYGEQQKGITGQYEETARALPQQYGALGIKNSSYYENAANRASDVYQQGLGQLQQDMQSKLADLGRFYETTTGQYRAQQQAMAGTPTKFTGTQGETMAAQQTLDTRLSELASARSGLKANPQYVQALQGIAPGQNTTADMLKKQLDELAVSSIPSFAKQTIGKGLIQKSGQDQTLYQDYFDKLQQGQSTGV